MFLKNKLVSSYNDYKISYKTAKSILLIPIVLSLLLGLVIIIPSSRLFGLWLLEENKPVELLTFVLFLFGGIYGFKFSFKILKIKERLIFFFYFIFSFCLIFLALEEIAWGQWFFSFETPEYWQKINVQGETTLHNLKGIQGNSEIFRFIFGFGGICGIFFKRLPNFDDLRVPIFLTTWFIIIIVHSIFDYISDYIELKDGMNFALSKFSEFIELLISISAFLYLILNSRRISN
ncbi:hypothetical protein BFR04_08535 [Gaetbulibacter sp. 4G1]|nr:hypothetical protein [Gaetbulibacter sp. 4G1]PIA77479.1 hypothetical protein BFR04_08535 [Gaetbulibacter sp. 4G1]